MQSPYRADHFGIDKIRQDVENANLTETDKEADKDVWMIWTKKNALTSNIYEAEKASDFDSYSGIESQANMINLEISPKRNMLRNGSFLRAMAYGTSGILFESGKKNTELRSNKNGDNVVESAPILVNDIPNPLLFIPITVKLTAPITYSTFRQLKGKNKGYIEFRYNNNVFKGFVLDVEANIAYTEVIELNLLLHPDTDLNNFLYL